MAAALLTHPLSSSPSPAGAAVPASAPMLPSGLRGLLRLEAAIELVVAVLAYRWAGGSWGLLAALFLVPDLAMLGYLRGPRVGAVAYNAAHTYALAVPVALLAWQLAPALLPAALVWVVHIAFDRTVGYGLKYVDAFGLTHLGPKGPAARR